MPAAGEFAGKAPAHFVRALESFADASVKNVVADFRRESTASGAKTQLYIASLSSFGKARSKSIADGLVESAAVRCPCGERGVGVIRDGRARPEGWEEVAPVVIRADKLLFREGMNSGSASAVVLLANLLHVWSNRKNSPSNYLRSQSFTSRWVGIRD